MSELDTRRRPRVQVEAPCSFVLLGGICGVRTLAVVYIQIFPWHHHNRPYHCERTASRLICEVKHGRARSVLGWGTTWEARVTIVFFLFLFLFFLLIVQPVRKSRERKVLLHGHGHGTRGSSAHSVWLVPA